MRYVGNELDTFANAIRWKAYVRRSLSNYIVGPVLEVGAGRGSFTEALHGDQEWYALEPDKNLYAELAGRNAIGKLGPSVTVLNGQLRDLPKEEAFSTILYMDVLEHIEDDLGEVKSAVAHLVAGGNLVILAPAFQFVYSAFDAAIGHFRRYDKTALERLRPPELSSTALFYLDAPGLALSLVNRFILRSSVPTLRQIIFWDRAIIPLARIFDPLIGHRFGRSIVAVWQKY